MYVMLRLPSKAAARVMARDALFGEGQWATSPGRSIALEAAVHGCTRRNAEHGGWFDRGILRVGALADINVIDLDRLELPPPYASYDLPAGGMRLMQSARGCRYTIKPGVVTVPSCAARDFSDHFFLRARGAVSE